MASTISTDLFSGLPNLHPAVVHLPLALLPVAPLFELILLLWARAACADRASAWLRVIAALATGAEVRAGEAAEDAVAARPPAARDLLREHERLATRALWLIAIVALLRVVAVWRDHRTDVVPRGLLTSSSRAA